MAIEATTSKVLLGVSQEKSIATGRYTGALDLVEWGWECKRHTWGNPCFATSDATEIRARVQSTCSLVPTFMRQGWCEPKQLNEESRTCTWGQEECILGIVHVMRSSRISDA